jgi:hypothetical protein
VFKYVKFLILSVFLSFPVFGQDETMPVSVDPNRGPSTTYPKQSFEKNLRSNINLNLDLNLSDYKVSFPNYWNTYGNRPHISYVYRYKGLQGLIYKHATRALNKYYEKALHNTWNTSHLSYYDLDNAKEDYALRASDPSNPWWERRYFFDNFPIEKGGSRVEGIIIGRSRKIFSLGPLSLKNSGKLSWSGWRLTISAEKELPTKNFHKDLDGTSFETEEERKVRDYSFGIKLPRGNLYTGSNWSVSGSVSVGLKVNSFERNRSSITGSLKILGHTGYRHIPRVMIGIKGKARPFINDYGLQIVVSILTF